jgi:rhamnosyltransferase
VRTGNEYPATVPASTAIATGFLMNRVCAIVVTYNPDPERLAAVLAALLGQVCKILVVDNGSRDDQRHLRALGPDGALDVLPMDENLGIGAALNAGIRNAIAQGFDFCLLMDQDSIATPGMVDMLAGHYRSLVAQGHRVAAIGPRFRDPDSGSLSRHVRFAAWRIRRIPCPADGAPVNTDYLITSGSLIPADVVRDVGDMDETLFIDHVDTEWTLRARAKGYEVFGDCTATMEHDLGEYRRTIWFLRRREIPIHKPFRYYYIFRNSISLYRRPYVPWAWRRVDMVRLAQTFTFMALFHPQRLQAMRMMLRGVQDGLKGGTGKLP